MWFCNLKRAQEYLVFSDLITLSQKLKIPDDRTTKFETLSELEFILLYVIKTVLCSCLAIVTVLVHIFVQFYTHI